MTLRTGGFQNDAKSSVRSKAPQWVYLSECIRSLRDICITCVLAFGLLAASSIADAQPSAVRSQQLCNTGGV